jgi:hypothetical protein
MGKTTSDHTLKSKGEGQLKPADKWTAMLRTKLLEADILYQPLKWDVIEGSCVASSEDTANCVRKR